MGYGWSEIDKDLKERDNMFLRFDKTGDTATVAFLGEPFAKPPTAWDPATSKFVPYDPKVHDRPSYKYKFNVYNKALGVVQIWEVNVPTLKKIRKSKEKYGLDTKFFEVEKGENLGDYTLLLDDDITPAMAEKIASCKLHELDPSRVDQGSGPGEEQPPATDNDVPF